MTNTRWLDWCRELQAIAQNGLTFGTGHFDLERYKRLQEIAAEMVGAGAGVDPGKLAKTFAEETGYTTPKVDVRGVVFRDGKILLVKEREDGGWTLPGGWADVGDTPAEAVVREIVEESGFQTRADKLLMVVDRDRQGHPPIFHHAYKLFIRCQITGGGPADSPETEGADFFAEENIPPLSIMRTLPKQLTRLFEHLRDPNLPTDFE